MAILNNFDMPLPNQAIPAQYNQALSIDQALYVLYKELNALIDVINNSVVYTIGTKHGDITLGEGLSMVGNQLTADFNTDRVDSLGGKKGDITLGTHLAMSGQQLVADVGVYSIDDKTGDFSLASGELAVSDAKVLSIADAFKTSHPTKAYVESIILSPLTTAT